MAKGEYSSAIDIYSRLISMYFYIFFYLCLTLPSPKPLVHLLPIRLHKKTNHFHPLLYSSIIELEPDDRNNYFRRASAYMRVRKYGSVIADLDQALTIDDKFVKVSSICPYIRLCSCLWLVVKCACKEKGLTLTLTPISFCNLLY